MITGNTAEHGGGIHCATNSSPTITGCTIQGNQTMGGASIHVSENSSLTLTDCTIADNTAGFSGGIGVFDSSLTIKNSIISNNTGEYGGGRIKLDMERKLPPEQTQLANGEQQ